MCCTSSKLDVNTGIGIRPWSNDLPILPIHDGDHKDYGHYGLYLSRTLFDKVADIFARKDHSDLK